MKLLLLITCTLSINLLYASNYYFSNNGDDSRTPTEAQNPATPWKSLNKLNDFFSSLKPGDSILFKRDEVFDGFIYATISGSLSSPIIFSAYGNGGKPIISGLTTLNGWTSIGNNIWETNCPASSMVNVVVVNGAIKEIGRYPNSNAANRGYLNYESFSGTAQITDNELSSAIDWTGGNVVIRKNRWVLDRNFITSNSGHTIEYISESGYNGSAHYGYFIQNHPKALDIAGEWYYHSSNKKLGIYSPSGNPSSSIIQASTIDVLVNVSNQSNLIFNDLAFKGANKNAFELNNTQHIQLLNCNISFSGTNAITASEGNSLTIENCSISNTNNNAIELWLCSGSIIRSNKIGNTGMLPGMGKGDSGSYEAIMLVGDNMLVELNEIDSTGYIPITFRGSLNLITNNYISNYTLVKDDGGGIYTWNNTGGPLTYGIKIMGNIVLNGRGAGEGTDDPGYAASNGIYMDDNTAGVEIAGNTVANCGLNGIYIHNGHEINLHNNTVFNSKSQLVLAHDDFAAYSPIRNIRMFNNLFVSKENSQLLAEFKTSKNDIASFGTFDSNYYCRPTYDSYTINTTYQDGGINVNLDEWKAMFGKDNSSKKSPALLSSYNLIRFEYNSSITPKSISLDGNYVDAANKVYNGTMVINPFSSVVLFKQEQPASICSGTGSLVREQWNGAGGTTIQDIPLQIAPTAVTQLGGALETANIGDSYGSRTKGFLCPPQTGNYTFWIAGDDATELWLSSDELATNKSKISYVPTYTGFREWTRYPSQKSAQVSLQKGRRYYIEVLQKEGVGGDHMSVAWQLPDGTMEAPIPAFRASAGTLAPAKSDQVITFSSLPDIAYGNPPVTINAISSSGLPVSFRIVTGAAALSGNALTVADTGIVVVEATQAGNDSYNPAAAVRQSFRVLAQSNSTGCSATGSILREQWNNVNGNNVSDIPLQSMPSLTSQLTSFEGPSYAGDRYASRIRGYICPPVNGSYVFNIASDDAAELWLSTDDNPVNKIKVAYVLSWTLSREWNKYASQKSAPVYLQAGKRYYVETLHKEGEGGDNLAVAWQIPGGAFEGPIPGSRLSPFIVTAVKADQSIDFPVPPDMFLGDAPFSLSATASSGLPITFRVVSGAASISGSSINVSAAGMVSIEASQAGNDSYNAALPVTRSFNVAVSSTGSSCSASGSIWREQWNNIAGNNIADFSFQATPGSTSQLSSFEAASDIADNYAARIRGYICPPKSGNYTFKIAGDDAAELWLSTGDDPAHKTKIAYVPGWTNVREWNKYTSQTSAPVNLQLGKRYYIEALHKEGGGGDNLSVGWQMPDGVFEAPVAGGRLSPYIPPAVALDCAGAGSILMEQWNNINGNSVLHSNFQGIPTSSIHLSLFERTPNIADNYASRISGYLCPPQTGNYTFYVAGDDAAELWLSTTDQPANKVKIAYLLNWTNTREWNKYASQKSNPISLQKGQLYYIEALHKEGEGGDNLAVAWQMPDNTIEAPIPGNRLVPYAAVPAVPAGKTFASAAENIEDTSARDKIHVNIAVKVYPNPFTNYATVSINPVVSGIAGIDVLDLNGRPVQHLFYGLLEKGKSRLFTLHGSGLPGGLYIIRIRTGNCVLSRKVALIGKQ